jgi:hypothetical protein
MKIIITESQLNNLYSEQNMIPTDLEGGGGGTRVPKITNNRYNNLRKCLPNAELATAVQTVLKQLDKIKKMSGIKDTKVLLEIIKYAVATMGRETNYSLGSVGDTTALAVRNLVPLGDWVMDTVEDIAGQGMSLGPAQFTKKSWEEYGLDKKVGDFTDVGKVLNSLLGTIYRIGSDYNLALKKGVGTKPSINPIAVKKGKIKNIAGSGNIAMDLAIVAHNMGQSKIKKYCKTSSPDYNAPCDSPKGMYKPFKDGEAFKVYTDKWIPGYFPNLKHEQLTSIGYVEEVVKRAQAFNCIT